VGRNRAKIEKCIFEVMDHEWSTWCGLSFKGICGELEETSGGFQLGKKPPLWAGKLVTHQGVPQYHT